MNAPHHRRAVVTGGLGFVGVSLCRRLLEGGTQVLVIDNHLFGRRKTALPPHKNLTVRNIDIRDRNKLTNAVISFRPDALFHLAAIAFIPKCNEDPATAVGVHLAGTLNVVAAATAAHVRHFHFASSAAVYSTEQVIRSEKETPAFPPPDIYSMTKLSGEHICERFHRDTGAHVVITRAFNIYGPHRTNLFLIPSVCEQVIAGAGVLRLGNLSTARDYIYVEDAVDAILQLMQMTKGLVIANVGSGRKTTVRELIAECSRIIGRTIGVISDKKYRRPKIHDRPAWQADIRHVTRLIGWRPTTSLTDGLKKLIQQ